MLFTEPAFLFLFLPILLLCYFVTPAKGRNLLLALASLIFYGWGEPRFVPIMLASIALNYALAIWIENTQDTQTAKWALALGITSDLGLLIYFKYANFFVDNLNAVLPSLHPLHLAKITLPLGISFFTFHKISYKVDVYRGAVHASRSPVDLALYILLFPQLIAGPIIRYHDIADQIRSRIITSADFAQGVRRFIVGLGKKMILANTVAVTADQVFAIPASQLNTSVAWLGIACYTLQIYFDFSGYSDMAIGLGRMFGFHFLENFDYPYVSRSITEFWRRWHISLSRWFRDYLYIPLGGNRCPAWRTYINLVTVFFLCGLWHGASWTFVLWGLYHGVFLVLERLGLKRALERIGPFQHVYALLVVMVGWALFRTESLAAAGQYLAAMFGLRHGAGNNYPFSLFIGPELRLALVAGVIGATPLFRQPFEDWLSSASDAKRSFQSRLLAASFIEPVAYGSILLLALMLIAAGTYNPFVYFRF
jgi:alginate O-acetyltransferase complex protein AlgI